MFYFWISLIFLIITAIPLIVSLARLAKAPSRGAKGLGLGIVILGIAALLVIFASIFFPYYVEYNWFAELGYINRFWKILGSKLVLFAVGTVVSWAVMYFYSATALRRRRSYNNLFILIFSLLIAIIFGSITAAYWNTILSYYYQAPAASVDPILKMSTGFYLFSMPFYSLMVSWLIGLVITTAIIVLAGVGFSSMRTSEELIQPAGSAPFPSGHILLLSAFFLLLLAGNSILDRYRLLYSSRSVVFGAGYTDVHFRLWAYWVSAAVLFILSVLTGIGSYSRGLRNALLAFYDGAGRRRIPRMYPLFGIAIAILIIIRWIVPWVVQTFVVLPNELALERPYLRNNIRFTQSGFKVDSSVVDERFYPVRASIDSAIIQANSSTLINIRLWDPRALEDNLKQQQQIRLYYRFYDIDIGRYFLGPDYREVMLSVRELDQNDLNARARTWVGLHLIYTHGMGIDILPVNEFLPGGQPNLLVRDIPPVSAVPNLQISEPRIYYGEIANGYLFAPTTAPEFDYPSGDTNVSNHYNGKGGVKLDNFFKRFAFGWQFGDYKMLFSQYFTSGTRILFRRDLKTRVQKLLPFLKFDADPYAIVTADGRIKYVYDTYTSSSYYPYSQPYGPDVIVYDTLRAGRHDYLYDYVGINYMRNAVKVIVDAYDGTVDNYIVDESDPIIRTYSRMFPGLFKPFSEMPESLRRHIRYPEDFLSVQSDVYSIYHMSDPAVFYQREDAWKLATENYRGQEQQKIEPYFVMIKLPEDSIARYMLMVPFTPQNRTVMNAWMAGQCDFPEYGKLVVYHFPKGQEVYGPQQIETYIDQNTEMSASMTLWGQAGSRVIRGNLLTIPLFMGPEVYMLYVEPVFLQAEVSAIPEIKRIVLGDQNGVVWDSTFDGAVQALMRLSTSAVLP